MVVILKTWKGKIISIIFSITLLFLFWNFSLNLRYENQIFRGIENLPNYNIAIVLGASVSNKNKKPSLVLLERLDKALELYRNQKIKKILLSGDNSTKYYDEVTIMKNYLLKRNVTAADIFLDHSGLRTYDSLYRAKYIFGIQRAIIITQNFHLYRSLYTARCLKIDTVGYSANSGRFKVGFLTKSREFLARYLAFLDCHFFKPHSKFEGKKIDMGNDGRKTWN